MCRFKILPRIINLTEVVNEDMRCRVLHERKSMGTFDIIRRVRQESLFHFIAEADSRLDHED